MLLVVLGAATGLFIYRMGVHIGRAEAEEEIETMRKKMDLESKHDVWDLLFYGDDK